MKRLPILWWVAIFLIGLMWGAAAMAAPSRIVEQAFVRDPSGHMTLDEVRGRPQSPFTGDFFDPWDHSVVWIRLRLVSDSRPDESAPSAVGEDKTERLRLVPAWMDGMAVFDPLQKDADGQIARLNLAPSAAPYSVRLVSIPVSAVPRDLWLRFDAGGAVFLAAEVLSAQRAQVKLVADTSAQSILIGMYAVLAMIGAIAWRMDGSGLGRPLFIKHVVNFGVAVISVELFLMGWLEGNSSASGAGRYVVEFLRVLNPVVNIWFFMKVLDLFEAPPWALQMQRWLLGAMVVNGVLIFGGQLILSRKLAPWLFLLAGVGLFVATMACRRAPLMQPNAYAKARRMVERLGLGSAMAVGWVASSPLGRFKTKDQVVIGLVAPVAFLAVFGFLALVAWLRILHDRKALVLKERQDELNELALDFERGERQRQQEFMVMLTHELKAPLSTLGLVLGTPTASDSMHRHARTALASMRQVIDHCAQSAEIEDTSAPLRLIHCSLWPELGLRRDGQAENDRIRIEPDSVLPPVLVDVRLLAVILNNLFDNALKYSPRGSQISATVSRQVNPQGAVQVVCVRNLAGPGPMLDPSRLFQKYYRSDTARRISGSGLGLYLSRALAVRLGGELTYQGDAQAIEFRLVLPEAQGSAAPVL
jgi:signal transduction histidine kinase